MNKQISGKWSVLISIHTRVRNAVSLLWGSLRLAPTNPCDGNLVSMCSNIVYDNRSGREFESCNLLGASIQCMGATYFTYIMLSLVNLDQRYTD